MNKTLLKRVSKAFRQWIHCEQTTKDVKLRLVRTLTSEDDKEADLLETARMHVGETLVLYAQGNPKMTTVKPYGLKAARSTKDFKLLPTTTLSLTFAALYQVLRTDPPMLDKWIKAPRQHITHPWPRGMIKRYVGLQEVFEKYRFQVFKSYEDGGGQFMGEEDHDDSTTPIERAPDEFEEDFD